MVTALIVGTLTGFVLSIPPGPIAIAVIKHALDGRTRDGYLMAASTFLMDTIYATGAAFASTAILGHLTGEADGPSIWMVLFQTAAIVVLVALGISYFKATTKTVVESAKQEEEQEKRAEKMGVTSPFLVGVLIALTNLASPTLIPSLIGTISYLHSNEYTGRWVGHTITDNILLSVGFGLGAGLWFVVMLRVLAHFRTRLSTNFIGHIYRFAGGTFILFAIILAYNVVMGTEWSRL